MGSNPSASEGIFYQVSLKYTLLTLEILASFRVRDVKCVELQM